MSNFLQAERESGIRPKTIGVIWENLTVSGTGGVTNFVKTFPGAFISFFNVVETAMHIFGVGKKGREVKILQDFRGLVHPGEMVLVLGRPGSGCTTFLKVIANQRFGYTGVNGEVLYGPFDAKTFAKQYRGEAVYNQEDDVHHPTLTVGQTLGFALDTKTPGKRPFGMSKGDFKDKVITTLLKMFNIEHTRNTIVGNPFVRGKSNSSYSREMIATLGIKLLASQLPVLTTRRCLRWRAKTSLYCRNDGHGSYRLCLGQFNSRLRFVNRSRLCQIPQNHDQYLQNHHFRLTVPS